MKTFKREWTGIDRLRMDKYYQVGVKKKKKIFFNVLPFENALFFLFMYDK